MAFNCACVYLDGVFVDWHPAPPTTMVVNTAQTSQDFTRVFISVPSR